MHQATSWTQAKSLGVKTYFTGKLCKNGHIAARHSRNGECTECEKDRIARNPEARIAAKRRYVAKNKDKLREKCRLYQQKARSEKKEVLYQKTKEWKANNREKINEYQRMYFKSYRSRGYAKAARCAEANERNAKKRKAMPPWANKEKILRIYETCPQGFHVDHIVPLQSKIVCGLHCEQNLRHLPAKENISKSNKYWPDMP